MSDFRCPRYWWDGNQWRCQNLPNDYLSSYDFDTYCTNVNRCLECKYMDKEVREKVAAYKKETKERVEKLVEENKREYEGRKNTSDEPISSEPDSSKVYVASSSTIQAEENSSGDGEIGCLAMIFGIVGVAFLFVLKIIPFFLMYYFMPGWMSYTFIGLPIMIGLFLGAIEMGKIIALLLIAMLFSAIPYWVMLFIQKRKRKMKWGETFKYYMKWFVKGPFAYKDIMALKNK